MNGHPPAIWRREGSTATHAQTGLAIELVHTGLLRDLPEDAMPARPRGDHKERTFNLLIRDGVEPRLDMEEKALIGTAPGARDGSFVTDSRIPDELRAVFGEILDDHYVIEGQKVRFLFPFKVDLPAMYAFHGRYKMFNGKILAFLSQPDASGSAFNRELIDRFYELFNEEHDLTLLDQELVRLARETAGATGSFTASAATLLTRYYGDADPTAPGALMPAAHRKFQSDLDTILSVSRLNRRDKVSAAVNVFYVHLGLYFQRLGWLLEDELSQVLAARQDRTIPLTSAQECFSGGWSQSPFAGTIKFRVATGRSEPVRMTDGVVTSYAEQNRRQLLLPANLSLLGAARKVMEASGAPASSWTFADMAEACNADHSLSASFDEGLNLMALATVENLTATDREDVSRQIAAGSPALSNLREALLKVGRSALRRHARDIVHFLVLRGGQGYISRRGRNLFFFEVGQDLLLLLAKLIVRDAQMPLRQFLEELRAYGFEPESRAEEDQLAETLRALNLLEKHSDAGEAMYVKHFL
jgi:hypothetical protein